MSFGFLAGDAPAMMRGSRVAGVVQQLATSVAWRRLDYLVVDMPPGTGDAQLTLCQELNVDAAVVVTTPSRLAFADVVKGVDLFDEVDVPVVAVVENMARYQPPTADSRREAAAFVEARRDLLSDPAQAGRLVDDLARLLAAPRRVFGEPHARKLRDMWGIDHAFELPLARDLAHRGDCGEPLPLLPETDRSPEEAAALAVLDRLADAVILETSRPPLEPPDLAYDGAALLATFRGTTTPIDPADLRLACRCAACIDEQTGEPNPRRPPLPADLRPLRIARTGNYAASIDWSDGHRSLYPFKAFLPAYKQALADAKSPPAPQPPAQAPDSEESSNEAGSPAPRFESQLQN